jgi:hypothetical protein
MTDIAPCQPKPLSKPLKKISYGFNSFRKCKYLIFELDVNETILIRTFSYNVSGEARPAVSSGL